MGYSAVHWNVKSLPLANYSSQSGNISFIVLVKYKFYCSFIHKLASNAVFSVQDPNPVDPQNFGFLDSSPQKYVVPRIRIQGTKYPHPHPRQN